MPDFVNDAALVSYVAASMIPLEHSCFHNRDELMVSIRLTRGQMKRLLALAVVGSLDEGRADE